MFSSQSFGDLMLKQMDPMNGIMQKFATQTIESQDVAIVNAKAEALEAIGKKLQAAKDSGAAQSTIEAFARLEARLSS